MIIVMFEASQSSLNPWGQTYSFWSGGMTIYGLCVIVVNTVLFKLTNNYTGF
jgi:prolipoprotein diacylglyceryltransferase